MKSNQYLSLFRLRFFQMWRMLQSVGWGLMMVFLVISVGMALTLLKNVLSMSYIMSVPACLVITLSLDYYRKDRWFLRSVFENRHTLAWYLAAEYALLTLPVWLYQCFNHFDAAFMILIICIGVGWLSGYMVPSERTSVKKTLRFMPLSFFELKFFIEKNPYAWSAFWLIGVVGWIHIGIYIVWLSILLMIMPEIFKYFESRDMLRWSSSFVRKKINGYIMVFLMLSFVPTITALAFHPDMYYVVVYLNICLMTAVALNISIKYDGYSPIYYSNPASNISAALTLLMLFPGGVIVTLGYSILKYFNAEKNLKTLYA